MRCALKELPHPVPPMMSFWWNELLRSLNQLPLVFLPPPPCYDLHKPSFNIQGAVFSELSTNKTLQAPFIQPLMIMVVSNSI